MSWSHSLRSPSPSSASPPPSPSTNNIPSLWGSEDDRSDPIDIGTVWEPAIKFTETPFTIAKRNGVRQSSTGSGVGKNAQKGSTSFARPRPAPVPASKPTPTAQTGAKETEGTTTKRMKVERVVKPTKTVEKLESKFFAKRPSKTVAPPPKFGGDVFHDPTTPTLASVSAAFEKSRVDSSSAQTRLPSTRPVPNVIRKSTPSATARELNLPKKRKSEKVKAIIEEAEEEEESESLSNQVVSPSVPVTASSSSLPPSSPPPAFQFYADSQGSQITADSSPPPPHTVEPVPKRGDTIPTPAPAPAAKFHSGVANEFLPKNPPRVQQIDVIRPTPRRPTSNAPTLTFQNNTAHAASVVPALSISESTALDLERQRLPSPFLSASNSEQAREENQKKESHAAQTTTSLSTRAKLEKFRNPKAQPRQLPSTPSAPVLPSLPKPLYEPQPTLPSPVLAQPVNHPRHFSHRTFPSPSARISPFKAAPLAPPPFTPPPFPRQSSQSFASTSKFVLPGFAPSVQKKQRMNFLPLESIESFQKRKGITCGSNFGAPQEDEDEGAGEGEEEVIATPSPSMRGKRNRFSIEEAGEGGTDKRPRLISSADGGSSNVFGSSLDDLSPSNPNSKLEKVVLSPSLRSFKPQSTSRGASGRGRVRGNQGRGGRGRKAGITSSAGNRGIESCGAEIEDEESQEERLRRLYRSLD
ncbi:uncharacterized protein JCM6883_007104 [Sporobolomyces salmoneus]|uniref:uncharacterized protein n=1 Tax=Sporobolomyces salmoneus TaxID=183962 RepID=UPI0031739A93